MRLLIALLFTIVIILAQLYYKKYVENFAVFPGTTKVIARKKIAGTGVACAGTCIDDPLDALKSTFNFPKSLSYGIVSDSKENLFLYDPGNKNIRKLIKLGNEIYGSVTIKTTIPPPNVGGAPITTIPGTFPNITIDSADNIYLIANGIVYRSPKPGPDNNISFTRISQTTSLLDFNMPMGITTDGINIYCMSRNGLSPYIVKLSPPTTGTVWNQQRLYPSISTSGIPVATGLNTGSSQIFRGLIYAKDRNELAFTTHNAGTVIIMQLNNKTTTAVTTTGASQPDDYFTTTTVNVGLSFPYGITYNNGFYYLFEAENAGGPRLPNTMRRINMSITPPTIEIFFGPSTVAGVLNSTTIDGVSGVGGGVGSFAGCFNPSGVLFVMDNTHTITMIGYESQTPTSVTDITDGTRVKKSETDDTIFNAAINTATNTNGRIMKCNGPLSTETDCYVVDYDGTKSLIQQQANPCIARNALFNVNNTGPADRCVVLDERGPPIGVPENKKGPDMCHPNQVFQIPGCYNKVGFIDYNSFNPTIEPMPAVEIDKIAQLQRRKNMLATASQLNMPKNTDSAY